MTWKRLIPCWVWTGILGGTSMAVDQLVRGFMPIDPGGGFAWALFIAWAGYFLAGSTPRGGVRVIVGYLLGIVMSIAIFELGGMWPALGFFAFPVAIRIVVSLILSTEKGPELVNLAPAYFLSGGTFFAIMGDVPGATYTGTSITVMVYCLLGCLFGFLTIVGRTAISKALAPQGAHPTAQDEQATGETEQTAT